MRGANGASVDEAEECNQTRTLLNNSVVIVQSRVFSFLPLSHALTFANLNRTDEKVNSIRTRFRGVVLFDEQI